MTDTKKPRLIAVYAFRYDAALIPDLKKNIGHFVDGFIEHDDRNRNEKWYHEGKVRKSLIEKAREAGADWILCIDPDERFEFSAGKKIRKLIETNEKVVYSFNFRELWTPFKYREDGVWDKKRKAILFPLLDGQTFMNLPVHSQWHPQNSDYQIINLDINLYHLKNIDPDNREARKKLYNSLDPNREIQKIGYDYIADESGLKLRRIPIRRLYWPFYKKSYKIKQLG